MRALSIRQPYADLILRGIKTVELRSRSTSILGERFYIYASKKKWSVGSGQWPVWSSDLSNTGEAPVPQWMIELAEQVRIIEPDALRGLPTGVIVGSAVIKRVSRIDDSMYRWHLADVERAKRLRKPKGHPQPVWFRAF